MIHSNAGRKMGKTFALVALSLCLLAIGSGNSYAQPKIVCETVIPTSEAFTPNGRVRADQSFLCVTKGGKSAVLYYRASAMQNRSYPGYYTAPWLGLRVFDDQGRELFHDSTFHVAAVAPCGGYHAHIAPIPRNFDFQKAYSIEISLSGNVGGHRCGRPAGWFEGLAYDIEKKANQLSRGEISEEEKAALKAYFGG